MKIPAIKAKIGTWDYYLTTLTFQEITDNVSKIDDELHKSESLKDLIQRSITDNYISIKEYILKQPEMFFNSLVLAVYDDYPNWREIEFIYSGLESYQMGLLEFPGKHKIFPIDGQHRVEGIKAAVAENPKLKNQRIAVIFIGHKNTNSGMETSRRLFTTLNRYAKPVTTDDIIALDEDDSTAIITRDLLEEYPLFSGKRVVYAKQKAIPPTNKDAITSIITLYQANVEIFKDFHYQKEKTHLKKDRLIELLKFRPSENEYKNFKQYCISFWDSLKSLTVISQYLRKKEDYAISFRNNITGGNILFRPIGFLPLLKAAIKIKQIKEIEYSDIFTRFNNIDFEISHKPWVYVLWNPIGKKMIMNSDTVTELLFIYLFDKRLLSKKDLNKLREGYAAKLSIEDPNKVKTILSSFK